MTQNDLPIVAVAVALVLGGVGCGGSSTVTTPSDVAVATTSAPATPLPGLLVRELTGIMRGFATHDAGGFTSLHIEDRPFFTRLGQRLRTMRD